MPDIAIRKQVLAARLHTLQMLTGHVERHDCEAISKHNAASHTPTEACKRDVLSAAHAELRYSIRMAPRPSSDRLLELARCLEALSEGDDRLGLYARLLAATLEVRLASDALYKVGHDPTEPGAL